MKYSKFFGVEYLNIVNPWQCHTTQTFTINGLLSGVRLSKKNYPWFFGVILMKRKLIHPGALLVKIPRAIFGLMMPRKKVRNALVLSCVLMLRKFDVLVSIFMAGQN